MPPPVAKVRLNSCGQVPDSGVEMQPVVDAAAPPRTSGTVGAGGHRHPEVITPLRGIALPFPWRCASQEHPFADAAGRTAAAVVAEQDQPTVGGS